MRFFSSIENARRKVLGINDRNLSFIYPYNPRKHFHIANDKSTTKKLLEEHDVPVPETYAMITNFTLIGQAMEKIAGLSSFVVKPSRGSMGKGILILRKSGDTSWTTPSGKSFNLHQLKLHIASILYGAFSAGNSDHVIIEARLEPDPILQKIYPDGIPDIRILAYREKARMAMLRLPTNISRGKANLHQGAMGIGIDLNTGILRKGYYRRRYVSAHPDTGQYFEDLQLPYWQEVIHIAEKTAGLVPLKYLGVDIILDRSAGPLIIEINVRPGLQIQNANRKGLREILNDEAS